MDTVYLVNVVTMTSALAILLILLVSTLMGGEVNRPAHRWFVATVLLTILGLACEFVTGFLLGTPGPAATFWLRTCDFCAYVFVALSNVTFALYLLAYLGIKREALLGPMLVIAGCGAASVLLAAVAQATDLYSFFDADNFYHQNRFFWVALIPAILSLITLMVIVLRYRGSLSRRELAALLAYILVPIVCSAIEVLVGDLWLSYFAAAITLYLVHLNLQVEMRRRMKEQEMALTESRVSMMISQIQPHFIFNTLSAIVRLCEGPDAREALTTFAEYLRVNMDSLSRKEPIPFAWEMEHVRQYLSLEGLRFEKKLAVVYDIRADQFALPALTVQPLVENAVRYGVTKRQAGGTVTIRAEDVGRAFRITVSDDGVGFDPGAPPADGRSHTGIENVRMRLAAMCAGTLRIDSSPGRGTTATIEIPKGGS